MNHYTFQRGETISLALDVLTGDPLTVSDISAAMKAVAPGRTSAAPDAPVAAAFDSAIRAADGENPAGWTLTLDAAVSTLLMAGRYIADARIAVAGGVIISEPVFIEIKEAVSG